MADEQPKTGTGDGGLTPSEQVEIKEAIADHKVERRLKVWAQIGQFVKSIGTGLIKLAVCLAFIGAWLQIPSKIDVKWVAIGVIGVFAIDLFKFVYIKTPLVTIDLRESYKPQTQENDNGKSDEKSSS